MLIRITNRCTAGCSHCFIDGAGPDGDHMSVDTFVATLELAARLNRPALLLSGGEPTEHPELATILEVLREVQRSAPLLVIMATNGHWALDDERQREVEELCKGVVREFQITTDKRFYKRDLVPMKHRFEKPGYSFTDHLWAGITPCKRTKENEIVADKQFPLCTNLRTNVTNFIIKKSMPAPFALLYIMNMLLGMGRICTPSVNIDGSVRAGEMDTCQRIGTVTSSVTELATAIVEANCDKCGLAKNVMRLSQR